KRFVNAPTDVLACHYVENVQGARQREVVAVIVVEDRFTDAVVLHVASERIHAIRQRRPWMGRKIPLAIGVVLGEKPVEGKVGAVVSPQYVRRDEPALEVTGEIVDESLGAVDGRAEARFQLARELLRHVLEMMAHLRRKFRLGAGDAGVPEQRDRK